jgi:hypothetical protein
MKSPRNPHSKGSLVVPRSPLGESHDEGKNARRRVKGIWQTNNAAPILSDGAPSGGTEFGDKVKVYAEKNIAATQESVRELSYAKGIQDMFRIQREFMRVQSEAFSEQAKDLGEAYIRAASGQTRKPPQ